MFIAWILEISTELCYNNAIFSTIISKGDATWDFRRKKRIRQRSLLTQTDFAEIVHVAYSTVNRWEKGKVKPNLNAMKNIKAYCLENGYDYSVLEEAWLDYKVEGNKNG